MLAASAVQKRQVPEAEKAQPRTEARAVSESPHYGMLSESQVASLTGHLVVEIIPIH